MEPTPATERPLRILLIANLPWDERLGATRVLIELAEQWRARGHHVEKFSLSDAFRDARAARVKFAVRQMLFPRRAAAFVRQNAGRFDVIDALIGALPFSKRELGFGGLLVARSIGLYLLYEEFERSVPRRWPQAPKGKLVGRVLYRATNRRLFSASARAVREADLINVPNHEEADRLRHDVRGRLRIVVQPYGLTSGRKQAFAEGACPAEARLRERRVCFIGMWGARKGAYDWARIIQRVREALPETKFRFLGTMIDDDVVRADLGNANAVGVELISKYDPADLPRLLSDCTAGAFPSYAEGFGLAVIEQLAAGIPTVAYDSAGPREILQPATPELLVENGDANAMAVSLVRLLQSDVGQYSELSRRCAGVEYSWPTIADATLAAYQKASEEISQPILFVQPFSIGSAGGGARILRALLDHSPIAWRSVCTSPQVPSPWQSELHLPSRPSWGRIEHSRLSAFPRRSAAFFSRRFQRELRRLCRGLGARALHLVPHSSLDFSYAVAVARQLSLPFFLSVHDDLAYTAAGTMPKRAREHAMGNAWRDAAARFVISDSLGNEYCQRYGTRDFEVVTDGLTAINPPREQRDCGALRIYFMGMFHMPYETNLRALLDALEMIRHRSGSGADLSVTLRCEHVRPQVLSGNINVKVLPFADEAQVARDMEQADLLYMPLPFGEAHANFARYSLSTKMVTYVGSGLPILYHGPASSAAFALLEEHDAAILLPTLDPDEIARTISDLDADRRVRVTRNALALAQRQFLLSDQAARFWSVIQQQLAEK